MAGVAKIEMSGRKRSRNTAKNATTILLKRRRFRPKGSVTREAREFGRSPG